MKAIPDHCFQSSVLRSFIHVVKDVVIVVSLWLALRFVVAQFDLLDLPALLLVPVYVLYWALQGTMFWAIFVLGHDCGHGSFSKYWLVNDVVGTILHSFILVPYYSWKWTHNKHHKNTGNWDTDEIFMPLPEDKQLSKVILDHYFFLGTSWFAYLFVGYRDYHSHLNPFDSIFTGKKMQISSSVVALLGMLTLVGWYAEHFGFLNMVFDYLIPVFIFASWLVVVTFLHHHEEEVPWYPNSNWNYVKGNLSSVDRDFGVLHWMTHNIGTHQVHHLFPRIPHYHLLEATQHFRAAFPEFVIRSDDRIVPSFIKNCRQFATQHLPSSFTSISTFAYTNKSQ